jgi:hypothetical protein
LPNISQLLDIDAQRRVIDHTSSMLLSAGLDQQVQYQVPDLKTLKHWVEVANDLNTPFLGKRSRGKLLAETEKVRLSLDIAGKVKRFPYIAKTELVWEIFQKLFDRGALVRGKKCLVIQEPGFYLAACEFFGKENVLFVSTDKYVCEWLYECNMDYNVLNIKDSSGIKTYMERFKMPKFDVVIGNPPYQSSTNSEDKNNKQPIWPAFLEQAIVNAKENGYIAFITPRTWASGSRNKTKNIFKDKKILELNMNISKYFNVGIDICSYIIQNCPSDHQETRVQDILGEELILNLSAFDFLPFNLSKHGLNIFKKTICSNEPKRYQFIESRAQIANYKGPRIIFMAGRFGLYNGRISVDLNNQSQASIGQIAKINHTISQEMASHLENILKFKFYEFLFNLLGGKQGLNRTWLLNALPIVDPNIRWTDEMIYTHFNLLPEEIYFLENNL